LIYKEFPEILNEAVINVSFRILLIVGNELLVFWIIVSTDLGEEGGLGLIINFASTMIICELDDMIFYSSSIRSLKERFDETAGKEDLDES
jgi:hypothetical protein